MKKTALAFAAAALVTAFSGSAFASAERALDKLQEAAEKKKAEIEMTYVSPKKYATKDEFVKNTKITTDNFKKETVYELPAVDYTDVDKKEKLQYIPDWKNPDISTVKNPITYNMTAVDLKGKKTYTFNFAFYSPGTYTGRASFDAWKVKDMYDSDGTAFETDDFIIAGSIFETVADGRAIVREGILGSLKSEKCIDYVKEEVSKEYLEAHKDTGIIFRVTRKALSNNKEYIDKINKDPYRYFHIPSYYIQAILEAVK